MPTAATLELKKLTCIRKQDVTGVDEPQIIVNGHPEWHGTLGKGDSTQVGHNVPFVDRAVMTLEELNGSKGKQVGQPTEILADRLGSQTADFKTSGAHYTLEYTVIAGAK